MSALFVPVNKTLRFRALPQLTTTAAQDWINSLEDSLAWSIEPVFVAEALPAPRLVTEQVKRVAVVDTSKWDAEYFVKCYDTPGRYSGD